MVTSVRCAAGAGNARAVHTPVGTLKTRAHSSGPEPSATANRLSCGPERRTCRRLAGEEFDRLVEPRVEPIEGCGFRVLDPAPAGAAPRDARCPRTCGMGPPPAGPAAQRSSTAAAPVERTRASPRRPLPRARRSPRRSRRRIARRYERMDPKAEEEHGRGLRAAAAEERTVRGLVYSTFTWPSFLRLHLSPFSAARAPVGRPPGPESRGRR